MTEKVNLYQDQRLDIADAKDLQDLVYEYVQRALRGVLGKGNGLLGPGLSVDNSLFTALNNKVFISGKEFVQRSSDFFLDESSTGVPTVKSSAESASGKGVGSAQVFLIDTGSTDIGQDSVINFTTAYATEGASWPTNATNYSVYARVFTTDSEVEGRVHWDSTQGKEVQKNVATRRKQIAQFVVDKASSASERAKDGYVRIFDVTSATDAGVPTLTPHMAYDLQAEGFSDSNTGNSIRKALENATAGSLSVPAGSVGGLYELVAQIVQQLGWLYDPTQNIPNTTFQKPEVGIKSIEDFYVQQGASYRMPVMLFSGIMHSDRYSKRWRFGSLGNVNYNAHLEDKTGATADSQGVFLGHFDANLYGTGAGNLFTIHTESAGPWADKNGPSYTPLPSSQTAGFASDSEYGSLDPPVSGTMHNGSSTQNANTFFDLRLDYDATKFKITAVHATPYADVGIFNTAGEQQKGSTGQHIATGNRANAPVVLVHQNSIYIRSTSDEVGEVLLGPTGGHDENNGPRSLCLTIFGYSDDGLGTSGWGSSSVQDLLDGDGPDVAGGQGTQGT